MVLEQDLEVLSKHIKAIRDALGQQLVGEAVDERALEEDEARIVSRFLENIEPSFEEVEVGGVEFDDYVGIDGSSRKQAFSHCSLIMATVTVADAQGVKVFTYPDDYGAFSTNLLGGFGQPAFAVKPSSPELGEQVAEGRVRFRPPLVDAGEPEAPEACRDMYWYTGDYNLKQMEDEVRNSLEMEALEKAVEASPHALIALDGTLIPTPSLFKRIKKKFRAFERALSRGDERDIRYRSRVISYVNSWVYLIHRKNSIIKQALQRGASVVGVVKRLERSKIAVRAAARAGKIPASAVDLYNDYAYLSEKLRKEVIGKRSVYKPMCYGPIETELKLPTQAELRGSSPQTTLFEFTGGDVLTEAYATLSRGLKKMSYYLIIPLHPLIDSSSNFRMLRVEIPPEIAVESEKLLSSIVSALAHQEEVSIPMPIALADSVCRRASASFFTYFFAKLPQRAGVTPSYDTIYAMRHIQEEGGVHA